ncbi:MAG: mandelate racemase/muconate lactonizing enzyme family protein [bacterium]|nr:mandelate racemase/muconate lactonizing enzyme family protein [bacterium]
MKIDHVEAINLRYEYPDANRFQYAGGTCTARVTTLVRVHTDTGEVGIGSVYSHPALVYLIIRDQISPVLRGEDPTQVEALWEKMYGITRWYGQKGVSMSAIGGVDTALWDLRGKAEGKPIRELLGGQKNTCPAYASGLLWKDIPDLAEEAARHIEHGFRRVKMRLARSEEYDVEAVKAVRKAIGPDNDIMADGSMRYHLDLARRMGNFLAEQGVFWFEEPFAPEDLESYAALRGTINVPLSAGENEFGLHGFKELVRMKAVDIVQPDASRGGGITTVHRVAQLAQKHGLRVAPHTWSDAIAITANAQVVSAIPNGITVEIDRTGTPFIEDLLTEPLTVTDGELTLSDRPGLGIDLNMDVVNRLKMDDPLSLPDGSYSDMVFGKAFLPPSLPYVEKTP